MSSIIGQPSTAIEIPCCLCGTMILPNAANQCGACLAQQFDLKSILNRGPGGGDISIYQCRKCRRYEHTETYYQYHEPESPSLLSLCLKNIPVLQHSNHHQNRSRGLSSVQLIDSMWIWTEPHNMRLKLRLTVRADVGESPRSVTIQQRLPVELIVKFKQCNDCNREYSNRTWQALVQVRQKRKLEGTKKGLVLLENALSKNADVRKHVLSMETTRNGFDFYFLQVMHAQQFTHYIAKVAPMKTKTTSKMVSEDVKNNTANVKHTTVCDLVPICRDDLVICDKNAAKDGCGAGKLSGRMCIVHRVSSIVQFVDAAPSRNSIADAFSDLNPEKYWKGEKYYRVVFTSERLVRFVVLDVELCESSSHIPHYGDKEDKPLYNGPQSGVDKYALADVTLIRESDFGKTDETFNCTTHLGNLLSSGDTVLGYDLVSSVLPGADEWSLKNSFNASFVLPDVVLVKKVKRSNGADEEDMDKEAATQKEKPKSALSKRKERRRKKQEKKVRELEAAASRMGFLEETEANTEPN